MAKNSLSRSKKVFKKKESEALWKPRRGGGVSLTKGDNWDQNSVNRRKEAPLLRVASAFVLNSI